VEFAHLHAHSEYTLTDGSMTIDEYLDRLEELGIPAAALTDTHNLFGAFKFHERALNRGIKPVLGVDLRVSESDNPQLNARDANNRVRVLVENREGYETLSQLISDSYRRRHERGLFVSLDRLSDHTEGLFVLGPPTSPPDRDLNPWDRESAERAVASSKERFGDRFFVEVPLYPSALDGLEPLVAASKEADVPVVPTRPAYFAQSGQEERLRLRRAVQLNQSLEDSPPLPSHRPNQYVADPESLSDLANQLGVSLETSLELAERCYFEFDTDGVRLPSYPYGDTESHRQLAEACHEALNEKTFATDESTAEDRLTRELEVIQSMGFSDYFLIVADVVNWAKQEGIRVGPGRGSAAGSFVAYLLDITTVDPFEFDLIFERFLNPQRNEMPDIDIDFADDRRDDVIDYVRERFGDESVAHIITFGNMKARNSIRDVGRIRGEPQSRIDELAETIPPGTSDSLERLSNRVEPLKRKLDEPGIKQWFEQAQHLEGMVRNASVHAAGILIVEGRLDEEIPLYYSDEADAVPASQFDMYDVETMGYLKLDVLGLKTLTLIDRTLDQIPPEDRPAVESLPDEDEDTFEFLMNGSLEGVFQFESAGSRKLIRNMEPENRKDIVDCIALYRPGPMEIRDDYLKRRRNPELVEYPHEDLEPILEDTYGLILYQEQVMAIAREVGGFSWSEADTLRKAMGKKRADLMEDMKQDFVEGATENGYDEEWARGLFDTLARFAEYGFNRSHSAAYGEITYITAYLKAHFTAPFYAAFLSVKSHDRDRVERIIEGMREDGIQLLPPCVNRSKADFHVEDGAVRYGLGAIKHVGDPLAEEIETVREQEGPFEGVMDFVERVDPSLLQTKNFQALAAGGVFDTFEVPRGALSDGAEALLSRGEKRYRERDAGQSNMFQGDSADHGDDPIDETNRWSPEQRRRARKKILGYVPGENSSGEEDTVSLVAFTDPGSVEKFGELASSGEAPPGPSPQLVARLDSVINDEDGRLLKLTDGHETIMVRADSDLEVDEDVEAPMLLDLHHVDGEWLIEDAEPIPSGDDLGIEIHLSGGQDLNQLRQLKKTLKQARGDIPVRLVVDEEQVLDVSQSVEPSRNLHERLERILGANCSRLMVRSE
jgi:DNA polymerase-3 subunit alpha